MKNKQPKAVPPAAFVPTLLTLQDVFLSLQKSQSIFRLQDVLLCTQKAAGLYRGMDATIIRFHKYTVTQV